MPSPPGSTRPRSSCSSATGRSWPIYPVRIAYPATDDVSPGVPVAVPASVPGLGVPGARRQRRRRRPPRHRRRSVAPVSARERHVRHRRDRLPEAEPSRSRIRRSRGGRSATGRSSQGSSPARTGLEGCTASRPARPSCRSASPAGSPTAEGGYAVYSRTDQVLAGLEAAVDPNDDGDTHDAARIALVGVAEPYASFPDGPLARAIDGRERRSTRSSSFRPGTTVGPGRRSGASPGRAGRPPLSRSPPPTRDLRRRPCASTYAPASGCSSTVSSRSAERPTGRSRRTSSRSRARRARGESRGFFDERGLEHDRRSRSAAHRAAGSRTRQSTRRLPPAPARSSSTARFPPAPSASPSRRASRSSACPSALADAVRALDGRRIPVTVSIGAVDVAENVRRRLGRGLLVARARVRRCRSSPSSSPPGVSVPTSEPGRSDEGEVRYGTVSGTSVSAAVAAGAAAVLAEARPRATALELRGAARRVRAATGRRRAASSAGRLDLQAAVQQESRGRARGRLARRPTTLELEPVQAIRLRNLTTRRIPLSDQDGDSPEGVEITPLASGSASARRQRPRRRGSRFEHRGLSRRQASRPESSRSSFAARRSCGVPWVVSRPAADVDLLSQVALAATGERITDATPAVVSFVARRDRRGHGPGDPSRRQARGTALARGRASGHPLATARAPARALYVRSHRARPARRAASPRRVRRPPRRASRGRNPEAGRVRRLSRSLTKTGVFSRRRDEPGGVRCLKP